MEKGKQYQYFDIPKQERDSVIGFLLNALLKARQSCRMPSNQKTFDEDVNIYLAHLLFANSLPDYHEMSSRYLTLNASNLMELVELNQDKVTRYFIYKINADYLLVHLGVFGDLVTPVAKPFRKSERQFVEMGQNYYDYAHVCNQQIYRKRTAVGDVLEKLSHHFDDYKVILQSVRKDFFHILDWVRQQSKRVAEASGGVSEHEFSLEHKQNEFLDLYGEWLKTKSEDLIPELIRLVEEIRRMDTGFGFDVSAMLGDQHNLGGEKQ